MLNFPPLRRLPAVTLRDASVHIMTLQHLLDVSVMLSVW